MNVLEQILEEIEGVNNVFCCDICPRKDKRTNDCMEHCEDELINKIIDIVRSHVNDISDEKDDLISRKALLEELEEFRMLITDSANAMALTVMDETKKSIMRIIDEQPTVYNKEKVLDQLEKCRDIMLSPVSKNCFEEECKYNDCTVCVFEKAIRIVQKGGVEK